MKNTYINASFEDFAVLLHLLKIGRCLLCQIGDGRLPAVENFLDGKGIRHISFSVPYL
jgi:hypothetical protein